MTVEQQMGQMHQTHNDASVSLHRCIGVVHPLILVVAYTSVGRDTYVGAKLWQVQRSTSINKLQNHALTRSLAATGCTAVLTAGAKLG